MSRSRARGALLVTLLVLSGPIGVFSMQQRQMAELRAAGGAGDGDPVSSAMGLGEASDDPGAPGSAAAESRFRALAGEDLRERRFVPVPMGAGAALAAGAIGVAAAGSMAKQAPPASAAEGAGSGSGSGSGAEPLPQCCQYCIEDFYAGMSMLQVDVGARERAVHRFAAFHRAASPHHYDASGRYIGGGLDAPSAAALLEVTESARARAHASAAASRALGRTRDAEALAAGLQGERWGSLGALAGAAAGAAVSSGALGTVAPVAAAAVPAAAAPTTTAADGGSGSGSGSEQGLLDCKGLIVHDPSPERVKLLRTKLPCCPVCYDQFISPEDPSQPMSLLQTDATATTSSSSPTTTPFAVDEHLSNQLDLRSPAPRAPPPSALLEVGAAAGVEAGEGRRFAGLVSGLLNVAGNVLSAVGGGATSKGEDTRSRCCHMCPAQGMPLSDPAAAEAAGDANQPAGGGAPPTSLLEVGEGRFEGLVGGLVSAFTGGGMSTSAAAAAGGEAAAAPDRGALVRGDGCCNSCPVSVFESVTMRQQEAQGGPFGLRPRVDQIAELASVSPECQQLKFGAVVNSAAAVGGDWLGFLTSAAK